MDIDKEELKNQTKDAVNQVKDNLKNVDVGKEAKETKGFIMEMIVSPFEKVASVANEEVDVFKKSLLILIVDVLAVLIIRIINLLKYSYGTIGSTIGSIILSVLSPILAILVPTIIILIMNKNNKKSFNTVFSTLVIAGIPSTIAQVLYIFSALLTKLSFLTSPIGTTLSAVTLLLTFTGMRELFGEEKETFLVPKYIIIEFITALVLYVL